MPGIFYDLSHLILTTQYQVGAIVTSFLYRIGNYNLSGKVDVSSRSCCQLVMELGLEPSSSNIRAPAINYYVEHHKFSENGKYNKSEKMLSPTVIIISLFYILFACLYSVLTKNMLAFQRDLLFRGILIFIFK